MSVATLCAAAEAPADGELARFEVDGTAVAVANVGGELYAFADTCTHRQCSLADGALEGAEVVCPCHHGTFDVTTGAVVAAPPTEPVAIYPVRLDDGQLCIEL